MHIWGMRGCNGLMDSTLQGFSECMHGLECADKFDPLELRYEVYMMRIVIELRQTICWL